MIIRKRIELLIYLFAFLFNCTGVLAQSPFFSSGISLSKINWVEKTGIIVYEKLRFENILPGFAINAGVEYLNQDRFSLSSSVLFYKADYKNAIGKIDELHGDLSYSNFSVGTTINFSPVKRKLQIILSFGPRVDFMFYKNLPYPFTRTRSQKGTNNYNYGFTSGLSVLYNFKQFAIGLNGTHLYKMNRIIDFDATRFDEYFLPNEVVREQSIVVGILFCIRLNSKSNIEK